MYYWWVFVPGTPLAILKILKYLVPTAQLSDSVPSCLFTPCQITQLVKRRLSQMSSEKKRRSLQRPVINKDPGVVTVLTSSYQLAVKGRATNSFLARVQQNCQGRIIWKFLKYGFLWHLTPRSSHPGCSGSIIHALSSPIIFMNSV